MLYFGGHVTGLTFSSDGLWIVAGCGKSVQVLNAESGDPLRVLHGHEADVWSVEFSRDGGWIVSGSEDRTVRIWDIRVPDEPRMLWGSQTNVQEVVFSPDGQRIVSRDDETIRVWDADTGEGVHALSIPGDQLLSYALSPDGRWIVCGSMKGTVRMWDAESGDRLPMGTDGHGPVKSVAFSPEGRRLLAAWGAPGHLLGLWDARTGEILGVLRGSGAPMRGREAGWCFPLTVARSRFRGATEITSSCCGNPKAEEQNCWALDPARDNLGAGIYALAFSPDGRHVVSGSEETLSHDRVRQWTVRLSAELSALTQHVDSIGFQSPSWPFAIPKSVKYCTLPRTGDLRKSPPKTRHFGCGMWRSSASYVSCAATPTGSMKSPTPTTGAGSSVAR